MIENGEPRHDLAVVIVSANSARWLPRCLSSLRSHLSDISADIVVVANGCTDDTAEVVERAGAGVRLLRSANRGFAAGNNRALPSCAARYVLFLNPDTEILEGDFADLLRLLDDRPAIGMLGCRHLMPSGDVQKTIRRFPSPLRVWGEALGSARWPPGLNGLGEIVLDEEAYESERQADWLAGSFMLMRAEALAGAGYMDERFFLYSEETDLCRRVVNAGWQVVFSPRMTILHHAGKAGVNSALTAQKTFARKQYADKHFGRVGRYAFKLGLAVHFLLRVTLAWGAPGARGRHRVAGRGMRISLGLEAPPFGVATRVAVDCLEGHHEDGDDMPRRREDRAAVR